MVTVHADRQLEVAMKKPICVFKFFFYVLWIANVAHGQQSVSTNNESQILKVNQPIERIIKGGETHSFQIDLKKSEYIRFEVEQKNVHVFASIFTPNEKIVVDVLHKFNLNEKEEIKSEEWITNEAGIYLIRLNAYQKKVNNADTKTPAGSYILRLVELRTATERDNSRIQAELKIREGEKLYSEGGIKRETAIKEYEAARLLFGEAGEREKEAGIFLELGRIYFELSKYEEAISTLNKAVEIFRETKSRKNEGQTLNNLGIVYSRLNQTDRAREYYKQALAVRKEIQDKDGQGQTLNNLGFIFLDLSQNEKATDYFEQALFIYRDAKNFYGERNTLWNLALLYRNLKQYKKAFKLYEQALKVCQATGDSSGEILTLFRIATMFQNLDNSKKARKYFEQALEIALKGENEVDKWRALLNIGSFYRSLKQYEKAREYSEQALVISQKSKDYKAEGESLTFLATVYENINHVDKARDYYEQALNIYQQAKDHNRECNAYFELGHYNVRLKQNEKALSYYKKALISSQENKIRRCERAALSNLADFYGYLKQNEEARNYIEQALKISRELNERAIEASFLRKLGHVYNDLWQFDKAREYMEHSLTIYRSLKNRFREGEILSYLGEMYKNLGQYDRGREYLEQSLVIHREIKNSLGESEALYELADAYKNLGQYNIASQLLEKVLNISKELKKRAKEAYALNGLGEIYNANKQYEKAIKYSEQALIIHREIKNRDGEGYSLKTLGEIYSNLGEYDKAHQHLQHAASIGKELKQPLIEIYALYNLVLLEEKSGNSQLAILYGKQTINLIQQVRVNIKTFDKGLQQSFIKKIDPSYRILAQILIAEGRLPEAQAVLDLLKEEEYDQIKIQRSSENPDSIPYNKAEGEIIAKIEKLAALGREKSDLEKLRKEQGALPTDKQKRLDQIVVEIETANKAFRLALDELVKSETTVEDRVTEIQTDKNLQRSLSQLSRELNTGTVAIYTLVATKEEENANDISAKDKTRARFGWVILVTAESRKAYPIDVAELEEIVFQFRNALSSDKYNPQPLAIKLYDKIFRQTSEKQKQTLEQDLEIYLGKNQNKTIMWSLDGVLRYIPMSALHDGKNYLVEKYQHIVFTKQSLLLLNERDSSRWQALGLGVSEAKTVDAPDGKKLSFSALAGARRELTDIVREPQEKTGILEGTRKLDKDFTKDLALRLMREGKHSVIHIASHYSFNPTEQTASFLLVGDGKLSFADIQDKDNLFGTVDLLTLSACDTAMSGNGKEAEGFAYLAQSLGAKSVIASLWKVSDTGTPELMIRFYKLRAENPNMPKGEAFRLAQLSLLSAETKGAKKDSAALRSELVDLSGRKIELPLFEKDAKRPFAHPHYWSSFVLIGNWR